MEVSVSSAKVRLVTPRILFVPTRQILSEGVPLEKNALPWSRKHWESKTLADDVSVVFALTSGFVKPRWLRKHSGANKRHSDTHT